jgi:hypothetical protein
VSHSKARMLWRWSIGTTSTVFLTAALLACPSRPSPVSISISGRSQFEAGTLEQLRITMRSEHGSPLWKLVSWGDGRENANSNFAFLGPCEPLTASPTIVYQDPSSFPPGGSSVAFLHRYRRPGTYHVMVHVAEYFACTRQPAPSGTASVLLHVTGSAAPGNGPADPRPTLGLNSYDINDVLTGYFAADDADGYVRAMTVTWIDGSTHAYMNHDPCKDSLDGWPVSSMGFRWKKQITPGFYVVKISAVSTDCRGGTPQMITVVIRFLLEGTGKRISWGQAKYLPHEPKRNGDSSLPDSGVYDFPFRPAP